MRIEKKIKDYLIFSGDSVINALRRINDNQSRIIFVVQDNGVLIGAVSDGDVRRWITNCADFDLNLPIDQVMNRNFVSCLVDDKSQIIIGKFDHKRSIIPLVDGNGRFVALARKASGFQLGDRIITDKDFSFIIAEVGNNHNGDFDLAKRLVNQAVESGADCVKFQMRDLTTLYSNKGKNGEKDYDLGSQYTLDLLNKFQLSRDDLLRIFDYCYTQGILPLCTPWDLTSARVLNNYGLEGFKVASADLTNFELLEALAETGKPLICSTGMSSEAEIKGSVSLLRRMGSPFALLHCNSTYPTPFKDINLSYLPRLKKLAGAIVGYSGHERYFSVPIAAVSLGARIIEKHITVDRSMEGNDHKVSLLPDEFAEMVRQIRNVEEAMGQADERELTQGEMINRENLAKSLVINCSLDKGQIIHRDMISVKSPGQGLQPNRLDELVGKEAHRNLRTGDVFFETDITPKVVKKNNYKFTRPYGIPVRYHDFRDLIDGMEIDFVEFHLSYHDLDLQLEEFFSGQLSIGFAVHSPELFAGDHILDLASGDNEYRAHSISKLKRVVVIAEKLSHYFPKTPKPVLVLNAGGWTTREFLPVDARQLLYSKVKNALEEVDLSPVQLSIQTMPPFPWHFGGQSYHNLFVDPDEINSFCKSTGYKICLDISHSMMACNYYKWDFRKFLEKVLPHTNHLHVVDAKGVDGEGVQIGRGDVDFDMLKSMLNEYAPDIQFIPEVWQGHKNKGEGFWSALSFLEQVGL
ncbi:MAG: TIM barrel protein [Bacteroidetes bacterium]|nr:TIM barrel protein [Bacteroidota bacterium]